MTNPTLGGSMRKSKGEELKVVSFKLSPEEKDLLKSLAEEEGLNFSQFVRDCIRFALRHRYGIRIGEPRKPRKVVGEPRPLFTEDDYKLVQLMKRGKTFWEALEIILREKKKLKRQG